MQTTYGDRQKKSPVEPELSVCLPAAEGCDHRSGRSPAQHPPRTAGQEERSQGQTGDPRLPRPREETQANQETHG